MAKGIKKIVRTTVTWFDKSSGEGFVHLEGYPYIIYACNIKGKKTWFSETACVYYTENQEIDIKIDEAYGEIFIIGLTPGTVDIEKWERIKDSKLISKCNDRDEPITGLFA